MILIPYVILLFYAAGCWFVLSAAHQFALQYQQPWLFGCISGLLCVVAGNFLGRRL